MTNENYEVLERYTFNRFIGVETNNPYAEYMSIHSIFGFIYYEYIHISTTIRQMWDDANIHIAEEALVKGNVKNYKIYDNESCVDIRNYFNKETATLAPSVRNRCPKTILKVNYKNYEYKHLLYPSKVIYIEGEGIPVPVAVSEPPTGGTEERGVYM